MYGGDEFLVFGEFSSVQELEEAVLELQKDLGSFNLKEDLPILLSISIGFAVVEDATTTSPEDFIRLLDERMYSEKEEYHTIQHLSAKTESPIRS